MTRTATDTPRRRPAVLRALALLAVVVAWLAIAGLGGPAIGKLSTVQTNGQEAFLPTDAESVLAGRAQKAFVEESSFPALIIFTAEDGATEAQLADWQQFAESLPGLDTAAGPVGDYLTFPQIPAQPSEDGKALLLVVPFNAGTVNVLTPDGEKPLTLLVEDIREAAVAAAGEGATANLTGPAGYATDLGEAFGGIDGVLLLVTLLAVLVILLMVYRAVALPLVVLFNSVCALAAAGGLVYLLADADILVLNGQSQGILFILTVGAATDYGLLLVARFREELTRHEKVSVALTKSVKACWEPIAASAGTVIAGLLCLLLSDLNSNRTLGPIGAIGILCAAIAGLTLLPAMLMIGRKLFWPRIPRFTHEATADEDTSEDDAAAHPFWAKVANFVSRHTRPIWIITAALLAVFCLAIPTFKASGTSDTEVFLTDVDSIPGQERLIEHFPDTAGAGEPVIVIAAEDKLAEITAAIEENPTVSSVMPVGERDGGATVVDGRIALDVVLKVPAASDEAGEAVTAIRSVVHAADPAALVGGDAALQLDTLETATADLKLIIPVVLIVVFLVLVLLLRALVAPLLLMIATVLSFGTALGVAALVFNNILDFPGADPAVPLFAFVFLVALGVDYSIFLMSRAREEVLRTDPKEGVLRALRVTGGVITSAGVVLAATFAALAVIPLLFLAQIAMIVAFGVLLDTLLVRSLLVPALALELGKKTWWPSKLSR